MRQIWLMSRSRKTQPDLRAAPGGRSRGLGLIDSSQQFGGAIRIAVASTVAAARSRILLGQGHATAAALAGGFHGAFRVCGLVGLTAVPVALLIRRTEIA